jgi:hypothetical protein
MPKYINITAVPEFALIFEEKPAVASENYEGEKPIYWQVVFGKPGCFL